MKNEDTGIDIPDITDELESAYILLLFTMVTPCPATSAETAVAFIDLSDGRKAQVVVRIDADPDRWSQ